MKRILIIEDNEEVRENIEEILGLYGFETEGAENGKIGVQKALNHPPDLILCDIMMPELDGFGVLNILSKKPATSDVPFIFLTAKSEKDDFRRGMNLGADDYLTKPFYKDELLQVIETRLQKNDRLKKTFDKTPEGLSTFIDQARGHEELKKLSQERKIKSVRKKELVFSEGDYARYLHFVNSGKIKLFKTNEFGKEYIINICKEGDFLGYTPLLTGEGYPYSAAAMEDSEISLIPKEDFLNLIHANRDVASRFIKILADNIAEKEEQLLQLAYNSIRKRVADALLQLHAKEGSNQIQINREDLSHIVGTAKESVIRMLTEFKNDGYIDIHDGTIFIVQLDKLKHMPG